MMTSDTFSFYPDDQSRGVRLDQFLHHRLSTFSRTRCQQLIIASHVAINGVIVTKPSMSVCPPMVITVSIPLPEPSPSSMHTPATLDLNIAIVADCEQFMIVNKPAGLVVHHAATTGSEPTLVDWIRAQLPQLASEGDPARPGIVHRLDKDTSGLMIIPKNIHAHAIFGDLFKQKQIRKQYIAVIEGNPPPEGTITYHITRHPTIRTRMTHSNFTGREACTAYTVQQYFEKAALIYCFPTTGRTHQIRVHCTAIKHPIIGDTVYGASSPHIARQALHAAGLSFSFKGQEYSFFQEPPADFKNLLTVLSEQK
jgi:23S rRNA pseudouridine1911/1915/1917 synthase